MPNMGIKTIIIVRGVFDKMVANCNSKRKLSRSIGQLLPEAFGSVF